MMKRILENSVKSYSGARLYTWYGLIGHPYTKTYATIDEDRSIIQGSRPTYFVSSYGRSYYKVEFSFRDVGFGNGKFDYTTQDFLREFTLVSKNYEDAAIIGLHQKLLKDSQSDFKAGTFLAELPSTVRFLARPFELINRAKKTLETRGYHSAMKVLGYHDRRFVNSIKHTTCKTDSQRKQLNDILTRVRKGRGLSESDYDFLRLLKGASNRHLAFTYGLMPILNDAKSIYDIVSKKCLQDFGMRSIYSTKVKDLSYNRLQNSAGAYPYSTYPATGFLSSSLSVVGKMRCKVSLTYRAINSSKWAAASHYALTNPITVAWEVLPYSFVVDWFVPMKKFFQTLVFPSNVEIGEIWSSRTIQIDANGQSASLTRYTRPFATNYATSSFKFEFREKNRVRLPESSFRDVRLNLQRSLGNIACYSYPSSLSMWLSGFEMLSQRFIR